MRVVDLTQSMTNGMPVMEGIAPPSFRDLAEVAADGYAMSQYTFVNHTGTHVDAPAHQIAGGATLDDIPLDRLVTEFVAELAFHVVNLVIAINPVRIAVGGGIVRSWDRLRPGLQDALTAGVPFPPELVVARFPSDAPLIGAVGLAVDAAREGGIHGTTYKF